MTGSDLMTDRDSGGRRNGRDPLVVRAIVALYPRQWRERYGEEFAVLLAQLIASSRPFHRVRLLANAAGGAADARLNLSGGRYVIDRTSRSLGIVACAVVIFAIAGAGFQKMTEYAPFQSAAHQHPLVGASFDIVRGAAVAAGIAVLISAVPLLWSIIWQAVAGRRADLLSLLILPPVAVGAWVGIVKLIANNARHSTANVAELTAAAVLGAVVAGFCAWAAATLLRRAELGERVLRSQLFPMIALTACMLVVTAADLSWGLAVRAADRPLFNSGDDGLLATPLSPSWAGGLVVLAASTAITAWATVAMARQRASGVPEPQA